MPEEWSWARQMAQSFMESDLAAAMSGVDILNALRDQGFGYRMTTFYDDLRRIRGQAVSSQYVQRLDPDEYVPRRYMGESPLERWHQPESLRYRMKAVFRDPETGREDIEYRALMTNKEMTLGDVLQTARDKFPWEAYGDGRELVGLDVMALYHLKGTPF